MTEAQHTENLPCKVDDKTQLARSKEMAQVIVEKSIMQDRAKEIAAGHRQAIKEFDARIQELNRVVHTGNELRAVECESRPNIKTKKMEIWRLDTATMVRTRPLSADELEVARQTKLDLTAKKAKKSSTWVEAIAGKVADGWTVEKKGRKFHVSNHDGVEVKMVTSLKALLGYLGEVAQ